MAKHEFLPKIRIEKIHLENFKGVKNGDIEFNCYKKPFDKEISADIMGIYGQNGSGKTTLLEALQLAKLLMMGQQISHNRFDNLISQDSEYLSMRISFQISNENNEFYSLEYGFSMGYKEYFDDDTKSSKTPSYMSALGTIMLLNPATFLAGTSVLALDNFKSNKKADNKSYSKKRVEVFDEFLNLSGRFNGNDYRLGPLIDTRNTQLAFVPKAKHSEFFPTDTMSVMKDLQRCRKRIHSKAKSFIFSEEFREAIYEQGKEVTPFAKLVLIMNVYAEYNIKVLNSIVFGVTRESKLRIYTATQNVDIDMIDSSTITDEDSLKYLKSGIDALNIVLEQLIPGLTLQIYRQVDINQSTGKEVNDKSDNIKVKIYSVRNDTKIPLSHESPGIIKLISALGLLSFAFINNNVTVAIDEIDAGIYEYLLGELISIFEEYGQGQLIFTCHNLRPLEVINKQFIYFTTTNEENRYLKPKYVREKNNFRRLYLQEIIAGGQDEELYDSAKHVKLASAFQKAGELFEKE